MTWYPLTFAACLSYWLAPAQSLPVNYVVGQVSPPPGMTRSPSTQAFPRDRLHQIARSITVKVMAKRNGGSGIVIQRQGQTYTVLTNRHVLNSGSPYLIQSPDGRMHPASSLKKINFRGNDLAVLQFRSGKSYAIATLGSSKDLQAGDPVVSAGFPLEAVRVKPGGFLLTTGMVSMIPGQAFIGGYQIGYTNPVHQGMSGGPVLNLQAHVVGINSLHAYPLWGNPYIFKDGSQPPPSQRPLITASSWAVPIDTFVCLVTPAVRSRLPATAQKPDVCLTKR